ncbi:MAG: class A beta-lactamase [Allosphingosinicella sp.]
MSVKRATNSNWAAIRAGLVGAPLLLLAGCLPQADAAEAVHQPTKRTVAPAPVQTAAVAAQPQAQPLRPIAPTPQLTAQRILDAQIRALGQAFNGDIGIAVKDIESGWTTHYDGTTWFPQQSVSKFWVALTAFDQADRGDLSLDRTVTLTKQDMTLFHQPIANKIGANGYSTTLGELIHTAITQSDNTANDFVLWKTGGPEAVRNFLKEKRISGVRFGPGERLLQSGIAGMEWDQSYSIGRAFYTARAAVPAERRRAAFERYIADPVDGATPLGTVDALARLKRGELLSPESTRRLLSIMSNTRTGPQRLKGGLAPGWRVAHKTGTGQVLGSTQAGYNDIGIVTAPDGRSYAVAVMIRRTSAPIPERMKVMQNTVRSVISYHQNLDGYQLAGSSSGEAVAGSR